jgi:hypothetical protein
MVIHEIKVDGGIAKMLYANHGLREHYELVRNGNYTLAAYILLGRRLSKNNGKAVETYSYRKFSGKIHCFHKIYRKEYSK